MYARIVHMQLNPYRSDEAVDITRKRVVPAAQQQQGFKGFQMLVDRSTGQAMTISFWEDEASRSATSERSGYFQEGIAHLIPLLSGEPNVEDFEIVIQE